MKDSISMIMQQAKRIFFVGIGGISMSSLAFVCRERGYFVAGSDRTPSPITERLAAAGIPVRTGPLAVRDRFGVRGKLAEIMEELDLTPAKVVETAEKLLDQFVD